MKQKGFTLIELLAVIVILAIIALIATPMILGVIEKSRVGASESSSLGYVDAIEKQIVINMTNGTEQLEDGIYDAPMAGISLKGNPPKSGWFKVENGQVTNYSFVINGYVVTKGEDTVKSDKAATKPAENNSQVAYYAYGMPTTETNYENVTYDDGPKATLFVRKQGDTMGVCLLSDSLTCFNINNYEVESEHLKEYFGEDACEFRNNIYECMSDMIISCNAYTDGDISCYNDSGLGHGCQVYADGTVRCD